MKRDTNIGKALCRMGSVILIILFSFMAACGTSKKSAQFPAEDDLFITRRYVGDFVSCTYSKPVVPGGPHQIAIKTTLDSLYGDISVYSKKCDFILGQRLYLRRTYVPSGVFGYWIYQVENDSSVFYRVSEFQMDDKILVQTWF
jgi:hypothetical protein